MDPIIHGLWVVLKDFMAFEVLGAAILIILMTPQMVLQFRREAKAALLEGKPNPHQMGLVGLFLGGVVMIVYGYFIGLLALLLGVHDGFVAIIGLLMALFVWVFSFFVKTDEETPPATQALQTA